ncbi:MAG: hypothetical protein CO114_06360, partial [Euryarchaeota archaeon CG_4_9_14_3_um_filter_38_12]
VDFLIKNTKNNDVVKELGKALKELNTAKTNYYAQDFVKSFKNTENAVDHLMEAQNKGADTLEITKSLTFAVRDMVKTNILYLDFTVVSESGHINDSWDDYNNGIVNIENGCYDKAVDFFKDSFKEAMKALNDFNGIDFGSIVRISYTDYDSIYPKIFLNGTINVGWFEEINNETHIFYARSSNDGVSWWYFDATQHADVYLSAIGMDPYSVDLGNIFTVTRALDDVRTLSRCHYFYTPIVIRDGGSFRIDKTRYSPINDPYLDRYHDWYDPDNPIHIGDIDFYIVCKPLPFPPPPLPPKAPDFIITNISFSNNNPVEDETITMEATVGNVGDASATNVKVDFYEGETLIDTAIIPSIPWGESGQTPPVSWQCTIGHHIIRGYVNPPLPHGEDIREGDTSNNELGRYLCVSYLFSETPADLTSPIISGPVSPAPEDITTITPTWDADYPAGATLMVQVSNDNGVTWEEVTNNEEHVFSSAGNQLKYKAELEPSGTFNSFSIQLKYITSTLLTSDERNQINLKGIGQMQISGIGTAYIGHTGVVAGLPLVMTRKMQVAVAGPYLTVTALCWAFRLLPDMTSQFYLDVWTWGGYTAHAAATIEGCGFQTLRATIYIPYTIGMLGIQEIVYCKLTTVSEIPLLGIPLVNWDFATIEIIDTRIGGTTFPFIDDMEMGIGKWTRSGTSGIWGFGSPTNVGPSNARSGTYCWATNTQGGYINQDGFEHLISPTIDLTLVKNAKLTFWQWYGTRLRDGGNIKISTDNGDTWSLLTPDGGYPYSSVIGLDSEPGYSGSSSGWAQVTGDLSSYVGDIINIKFNFGSSYSVTESVLAGWYIDDVKVFSPNDIGVESIVIDPPLTTKGIDTTPPTVTGHVPSVSATNVLVGANIEVTFSEPMDTASVQSAFSSSPNLGTGSFTWFSVGGFGDKRVVFNPDQDMTYGTTYTITIGTGAKDKAGNNMASAYSWYFTTQSDTTPPTVTGHVP